jgi:hypothetical protein
MPTAAKLVAFICYSLIAALATVVWWYTSEQDSGDDYFYRVLIVTTMVGGCVGWYTLGQSPHFGGLRSIYVGLRTSLILVFVIATFYGGLTIILIMLNGGVIEILQFFRMGIRLITGHIIAMAQPPVFVVLFGGGILAGRLTGLANKYWR